MSFGGFGFAVQWARAANPNPPKLNAITCAPRSQNSSVCLMGRPGKYKTAAARRAAKPTQDEERRRRDGALKRLRSANWSAGKTKAAAQIRHRRKCRDA